MGSLCTRDRNEMKPYFNMQKDDLIYNHLNQNQSKKNYNSNFDSRKCIDQIDDQIRELQSELSLGAQLQNELLKAKDNKDITVLVENMQNDTKSATEIQMNHPWAQNPKTIGSIATIHLVKDEDGYNEQEENIQKNLEIFLQLKGREIIINNLHHKDTDRVQITILFLIFLSELRAFITYQSNEDIFQGILPYFYKNDQNSIGLRIACGFILREIYKNKIKFVNQFIQDEKAIESLINLFDFDSSQYIIEGLSNLDDLCNDAENNKIINISAITCKKLYDIGFYAKLEKCRNRQQQLIDQNDKEDDEEQKEILEQRHITIQLIDCLMDKLLQNSQKI